MSNYRSARPAHQNGQRTYGRNAPNRSRNNSNNHRNNRGKSSPRRGAYIHPSKFISAAKPTTAPKPYSPTHHFTDFHLHPLLAENITAKGYDLPSPIQDQAIPPALDGKDIIGLANTGTGKTAAFLLPIIHRLYTTRTPLSTLILAPTRELAQQIDDQFRTFATGMKLFSTLLVGGTNIGKQISQLRRRPHVVIATPGRTMDLIKREILTLDTIDTLVLDEADRMLDMGFITDIRTIASQTPTTRQTLFFSATMTPQIHQLTQAFLKNPELISVKTTDTSENVNQNIVEHTKENKLETLIDLLSKVEFEKVLLFSQTKHGAQRLSDKLNKLEITSVAIHGNKSQSQRQKALSSFKAGNSRIMVATDVAARGLDIPNVSHVINFDQPATYEDYIHRIGRTGRGGATGHALTFVDKR